MKVLWLCGVLLPDIALSLKTREVYGGWLTGLSEAIKGEVDLTVLTVSHHVQAPIQQTISGIDYRVLPASFDEQKIKSAMADLLLNEQFSVVHLFGSEYAPALWLAETLLERGQIDRAVLHIQGLVSEYAARYAYGIPFFWKHLRLARDLVRDGSVAKGQRDFYARGENEKALFALLHHVSGRTDWDRACAQRLNARARYHCVHETLRSSFYTHRREAEGYEKHSIFISQGSYPVKGLHQALKALPGILRRFPDAKLYVAGDSPLRQGKDRLKESGYALYLRFLLFKNGLKDHVVFLGPLAEQEMCARYLKSHVFLSPSSIENSPNSLGEAMLLGLPSVSSDVGGVRSMMEDQKEGLLYPFFDTRALTDNVIDLFENEQRAFALGENARRRALCTHDAARNARDVLDMYRDIAGEVPA